MKPIRSNELEFFKELINDRFKDKQEAINTEIHFEADKLAEKNKSTFAKDCGVSKDLKQLAKANKEYLEFIRTKSVVEEKLLNKVDLLANVISNRLERLSKTRKWDTSFNNFNAKEDGVEYFTNKLDEVCYEEAKEHIKKSHKLYHALKEKRDNCRVIVHTGSDINSTCKVLQKEMASADIKLAIPEQLLQLAVK
tara:strand:+ start:67 stop:651 length:585 start_codon:yes stop_codon:yes gene_type:complete